MERIHFLFCQDFSYDSNNLIHIRPLLCVVMENVFFYFVVQRWKMQAEANDEAERLLSSQPIPLDEV
jgi:hypothetical protein